MGRNPRAGDVKPGTKVKIGKDTLKVEKVRKDGETVNLVMRGRGVHIQENYARDERV